MKNFNLIKYTNAFLTFFTVVFGLTAFINAAVKPELVNKANNGDYANNDSRNFSISGDGRYVVFESSATNLLSGVTDTNNGADIFLRDTQLGTIRCLSCVSAANPTSTGNSFSYNPIITPDGRYVVFGTRATDLVGGIDINNDSDIVRFDTFLNERVLVSAIPTGAITGNGYSGIPLNGRGYDVSDDGRFIAFMSRASNLTAISDTNDKTDIFVRDMETNLTRFISRNTFGNPGNNENWDPSISANGQLVAFTSLSSDLLPAGIDGNVNYDIFVYNLETGSLRCASMSTRTDIVSTASSGSVAAVISKDGNRVAYFTFANDATNVPIPFGNPFTNIVVHDLGFNQNTLISVNVAGNAGGNNESGIGENGRKSLSISANGRYVTFESKASNLNPLTVSSAGYNVFRRDLSQGKTELVSVTPAGIAGSQNSFVVGQRNSAMSRDGRFIAFYSTNSFAADITSPGGSQIYVRDMANGITNAMTLNNTGTALGNGDFNGGSTSSAISANGKAVAFLSISTDLTSTPTTTQFFNIFKSVVPAPQRAIADFDGDGRTDYSVFRASNGAWYNLNSDATFASYRLFGLGTDIIAPADYSGDGRTDYAVFRPSNGTWYISDGLNFNETIAPFGISGDKPMPQDYDGDGKADIAVYRAGTWWQLSSRTGQTSAFQFGLANDIPVAGDFDGDGRADHAVFRPSNGTWYVRKSSNESFMTIQFGTNGDKPVAADFDADGKTDIAVFRAGIWYVLRSTDSNVSITQFGLATDKRVVGDYDGDGKADIAVWRSTDGNWYVLRSANNAVQTVRFGLNGDAPLPAAFIQ